MTDLERELTKALRLAVNTLNARGGPTAHERQVATTEARRVLAKLEARWAAEWNPEAR